jgi:hypothetical protein
MAPSEGAIYKYLICGNYYASDFLEDNTARL